jgi:hypothetical protein
MPLRRSPRLRARISAPRRHRRPPRLSSTCLIEPRRSPPRVTTSTSARMFACAVVSVRVRWSVCVRVCVCVCRSSTHRNIRTGTPSRQVDRLGRLRCLAPGKSVSNRAVEG